ncbi:hypothetical protein N9N67_09995, partial [Bacteriovoracaceae bacterium]|nr:hypothetical protein [Bacteriovoracaceae bacterium]
MIPKVLTIHSLSPMGEGIAHDSDQIFYIPKTCPGDQISINKVKRLKKDIFKVESFKLLTESTDRRQSICPFFHNCGGCDYLHLPYSKEIENKVNALYLNIRRGFANSEIPLIQVHSAQKRIEYRNRIQLQIDKKQIGFMQQDSHNHIPIENCLLAEKPIQAHISSKQFKDSLPKKGHMEITFDEKMNKIKTNHNQRYAADGFSQVNRRMNEALQEIVLDYYKRSITKTETQLIELFSGSGNLSNSLKNLFSSTLHIDSYDFSQQTDNQNFLKLNLYKD